MLPKPPLDPQDRSPGAVRPPAEFVADAPPAARPGPGGSDARKVVRVNPSRLRPRPALQFPAGDAPEGRADPAASAARPARDGGPAPTPDARDEGLDARVAWIMEAGDEDEFVGRVFDGMTAAIVEREGLLDALMRDGRVGQAHRASLAAQLDHVRYSYLEAWETGLLEAPDTDAP